MIKSSNGTVAVMGEFMDVLSEWGILTMQLKSMFNRKTDEDELFAERVLLNTCIASLFLNPNEQEFAKQQQEIQFVNGVTDMVVETVYDYLTKKGDRASED